MCGYKSKSEVTFGVTATTAPRSYRFANVDPQTRGRNAVAKTAKSSGFCLIRWCGATASTRPGSVWL